MKIRNIFAKLSLPFKHLSLLPLAIVLGLMVGSGCGIPLTAYAPATLLNYRVNNLQQFATLYTPPLSAQAGVNFPVVMLLHGGFWGDNAQMHSLARKLVAQNYIVAIPTYRGEKRQLDKRISEGQVELCEGEVTDVFALLQEIKKSPLVNKQRIGLVGFSHGGCIALRVAQQDPSIKRVITLAGVINPATAYDNMRTHGYRWMGFHGWLGRRWREWVKSTPKQAPLDWSKRSPLSYAFPSQVAVTLIHGTKDNLIPVNQVCEMRDKLFADGRPLTEKQFTYQGELTVLKSPCNSIDAHDNWHRHNPETLNPQIKPVEVWYLTDQGHFTNSALSHFIYYPLVDHILQSL